jgi:hypothetical protein
MTNTHFRHLPVVDLTDVCLALLATDVCGPRADMS